MSNHRVLCRRLAQTAAVFTFVFAGSASATVPAPSAGANVTAHQAHYTYRTLDYPGASDTILFGINDFGEITGQYNLSGLQPHAMLYRRSHFETLNPGGLIGSNNFSAAGGPNNLGVIFIDYADTSGLQHGLLLQWGQVTKIDFPGHPSSNVDGVSLSGAITGVYWGDHGYAHGILRQDGQDTLIDVAGSRETYPLGNNGSGEMVGFWETSQSDVHGFYRSLSGQITSIDVPIAGTAATIVYAINDVGQIAGEYFDTSGGIHGFVRTRGQYESLDVPGAATTYVTDINNFGVAVGQYTDVAGNNHGFVATPW